MKIRKLIAIGLMVVLAQFIAAVDARADRPFSQSVVFVGNYPSDIAAGDFDANGVQDLVVCSYFRGFFSVILRTADGGAISRQVATNHLHGGRVRVRDMNQDGRDDVVVSFDDEGFSIWLGVGDGTFGAEAFYEFVDSGLPRATAFDVADFDGDGDLDVLVGTTWRLGMFPGNGNGSLGAFTGTSVGGGACQVVAGHFDSDSAADFIGSDCNAV